MNQPRPLRLALLLILTVGAIALLGACTGQAPGPPVSPSLTPSGNSSTLPTAGAGSQDLTIENGEVTNTLQYFAQSQPDLKDKYFVEIKWTQGGKTELQKFQAEENEWAKVAPGYKVRAAVRIDADRKVYVLKTLDVLSKPS